MRLLTNLFKPTPLLIAIERGHIRDIRRHLDAGTDPNQIIDGTSYPLHFAVHSGSKAVKLLLDYGAKPNVANEWGRTPLHTASEAGYGPVVALLVKAGANVNAPDKTGHTPLYYATHATSVGDFIQATTGVVPSSHTDERRGRNTVARQLEANGASLSKADNNVIKELGSLTAAEHIERHMVLAARIDPKYHQAVSNLSIEYTSLYDGFRMLSGKSELSAYEAIFIDNFEEFDEAVRDG